jgi:hypothetical protein
MDPGRDAIMSGVLTIMTALGVPAGFSPATNTYTSGTSQTENVPAGASQLIVYCGGGGGGGGAGDGAVSGGGGGEGGQASKTFAIVAADFGNPLTWTVGDAGDGGSYDEEPGDNGGTSTITGTIAASTLNLAAIGGQGGGASGSGGLGGAASGGSANTTGDNGSNGGAKGSGNSTYGGDGGNGRVSSDGVDATQGTCRFEWT